MLFNVIYDIIKFSLNILIKIDRGESMSFFNKKKSTIEKDNKNKFEENSTNVIHMEQSNDTIEISEEIAKLKESMKFLSNASSEISSSAKEIASCNMSQSTDLNSTSDMLKDFHSDMEELAYNVTNVQIKVMDTDKMADNGLETMQELDSSLNELHEAFDISTSTVNDLVSKLESVNLITDSISQIASQTNLLALNAAIEAARAGEAGKGFSVVAGEVRKLAENSKNAVQNITKILEEIKVDILNTSSAMSSGNNAIETQHNTILETKDTFSKIKEAIDESAKEIDMSIANLTQASDKKDKIIASINDLSTLSEENSSLSQEMVSTIENQDSSIKDMYESIKNIEDKLK